MALSAQMHIANHFWTYHNLLKVSGSALILYIRYVTAFASSILFMSATLSGVIALENARPIDGSLSSIMFDRQIWLGPECVLTGIFCHYNSSNESFPEVS
jgi:hypothetical protein